MQQCKPVSNKLLATNLKNVQKLFKCKNYMLKSMVQCLKLLLIFII